MTLSSIANIALSGLNTAQAGLRTTSNHLSNVNTEGYTRREQIQEALLVAGQGSGVAVAETRRVTDEFLSKQLLTANGDAERYTMMKDFFDRFESTLGEPGANSTITGRIDQMFSGVSALAIEPDSAVRRTATLTDIQGWGDEVSRLADKVQQLRQDADRQIKSAIDDVNNQLQRIHELNSLVARETHLGHDATTLEEQRDDALKKLSQYMDVGTYDMGNGFLGVTGARGMVLVDSGYRQLSYNPAGAVSTATRFQQIQVSKVDLATGLTFGNGLAFDPNRGSGKLDALLTMRDSYLPDFAAELGEMAGAVIDQFNAVHNENSAVPPPSTLTGRNTGLAGTDAIGFTGVAVFASLDANNNYVNRVTVDFTNGNIDNGGGTVALSGTTLADLINDLNGANGFNGSATASLTSGVLSIIAAGGATGVATMQDPTTPSDRGGRGFSHFFGLNDLLTASAPSHFDTGLTAADAHGLVAGGTMNIQLRGPAGQTPVTFNFTVAGLAGLTMQDVVDELNTGFGAAATFSLNAAGALVTTPSTQFPGYKIVVTSDTTARGTTQVPLSELFGIGPSYTADAARNIHVVTAIQNSSALFATAQLDDSAAAIAGTVPALAPGDNRGAVAFHQISNANVAFAAAGRMAAGTQTLAEYSGSVLSDFANAGSLIDQLQQDRGAFRDALKSRIADATGVNLDEELSNMLTYQNAFSASARLITTVQQMFDDLLQAV